METALNVRCAPLVAALVLAIGVASGAKAQEVDLAELEARTRPGDMVSVTEAGGRETTWKLGTVPLRTLIQRAGLSVLEVTAVTVQRADSLWNGALIGLAVAGVPWLVVCAANDWCYYNEYGAENMLRTMAVMTAAAGAGIGALVDRSLQQRLTIYEAPKRGAFSLGLSPDRVAVRCDDAPVGTILSPWGPCPGSSSQVLVATVIPNCGNRLSRA